jgi:hypothetical protein
MKYTPPKYEKLSEMSSIDVARLTEDEARSILEGIRWGKEPICPHCGSFNVTRLKSDMKKSTRDGVRTENAIKGFEGKRLMLKGLMG